MITTLSLLFFFQCILSFSTDWSTEFDYETYIDENHYFKLYWTNLENDIIEFGIEVKATGWIALGISPRGQMPNSDIAFGWVDDDGNAFIQDRYTEGRSAPLYDSKQNLTLIEGEEADGMTRLRFRRPKYSCDPDDLSISQGTTRIIWAFHATQDPESECFDSSSINFHTNKGVQSINLDTGIPKEIELEDDIHTVDIMMNNVSVPAADTTYYCKLIPLPKFDTTQYAVKFETIVEEGNEAVVHHLIAYYCDSESAEHPDNDGYEKEGPCDEWSKNMPATSCRGAKSVYGWAVGGHALYMPSKAAYPMSGDSDLHYILLEIHYDNPLEKQGIIDSSGFRIYLTSTPREHDIGGLSVGLWPDTMGQWIPAGLSYAHNAAFMKSDCTQFIPDEGVNVFGSQLHQHGLGRASVLRLIRNGVELPPIDLNLNYDFNYQQTIIFDEPFKLYPGDELIYDCWMNSSERTTTTIGGESSSEEMCIGSLLYYPAMELVGTFVTKNALAIRNWMNDAQQAGYLSGNSTDIENGFDISELYGWPHLKYYSEKEGALDFYNQLWDVKNDDYNLNDYYCISVDLELLVNDTQARPRSEPEVVYDYLKGVCDGTDNIEDNEVGVCVPSPTMNPVNIGDPNGVYNQYGGLISILSAIITASFY